MFLASSCEKNEIEKYDLGTEFFISSSGYTSLDDQVTVSIANDQKNLSSITVTHLGGITTNVDADGNTLPFNAPKANLGSISLTDGAGSMTISDSDLGMTEIGWSADFQFDAVFDGKPIVRYKSITVDDPISVKAPSITHKDKNLPFLFSVDPVSATVTSTVVETKVSEAGTYAPLTIVEGAEGKKDTVFLNGINYHIGDTVFVKVTASTATKTASTVTKMVVAPNSYEDEVSFKLDTTTNLAFNLVSAEFVDASTAGDTADVEFTAAYPIGGGPVMVGFVSNNNAEFVAASADDYDIADVVNIEATDFSAAVQTISDAHAGNVYIFRTRRGTGDWAYGVLKVTAVDKPQGVLEDSSISIMYKH